MGDVEEYFPRGGKKPSVTYFKQSGNFLGAAEKGERKKQKPKKKSEDDDGYLSDEIVVDDDQSFKNCGIYLNYKIVKEGQVLLGRVWTLLDTKIQISLPCRLSGTVMACHVSESYNKMLEAYVNDQTDNVRELAQMFRPGQYVAVRVMDVGASNLMLSMMPQHVNSGRPHSDLHKGALLQAAVASVEDHGYVMEVGIGNTRAFLPKTAANPEVALETGVLTWCCVKSIAVESDSSVLTLSSELEALQNAVQKRPTSTLMPGTALDFTVDKSLDNGIEGHVFHATTAYVQRHQVDKVKGKKPNYGQRIRARVLYVLPTRSTPFLTMKNIFESTYPDLDAEQKFKQGDIIEDAQVIKIMGRSIHFKLGKDSVGTISRRRIQVDEDLADEDVIAKSYPIGSTHTVRVLCYNLSDYIYSLSDEPAILSERIFTISDLAVGDIVSATVKIVADAKLILTVGRLTGSVPQSHMSDSGLYMDPKKASTSQVPKKFKVGQKVKARVLHLDLAKSGLLLTLKPSLLVPDLDILQSYEDVEIGKVYTGVVMYARDYLVVTFFNNVRCYVARHHVAKPAPTTLENLYHLGQIVNCTIIKVNVANKKMAGSLLADPFDLPKKEKKTAKRQNTKDMTKVPKKKQKVSETELVPQVSNKKERKNAKNKTETSDEPQNVDTESKNIEENDQHDAELKKRKRKKVKANVEVTEDDDLETELFLDEDKVNKETVQKRKIKRKDKEEQEQKSEEITKASVAENETENKTSKRHKKSDNSRNKKDAPEEPLETSVEKNKNTDESDAIETDFYEDSDNILTPQDQGLVDMSDCTTIKHYKRRIASLMKAIKVKLYRIKRIDNKIVSIEAKGINSANKKFYTAMLMEKLLVEKRIHKLIEVVESAKERFKHFHLEVKKDKTKKEKKIKNVIEYKQNKTDSKQEESTAVDRRKDVKIGNLHSVLDIPSAKDFWAVPALSEPVVEHRETSSSAEEEEEKPKKKRKKLRANERVAKAREEEERIRQIEASAADATSAPRSADQFERALLANPDSSQLWIAYMAFHLQATEIEKARAVGRRALKTISFREEQEKLNVWLAMLNFEHRFGTKESQEKTLDEALQMNEKYQIHSKLLDIYVETGKVQELLALVELMLRKYRRQKEVYIDCGSACYSLGLQDKARQVMQKGISALERREHVSLLIQFAQLERSSGSGERAEALFEQVLAVYPQRVDVCAVYVDMLVKSGDAERVRQVMERMTSQKMPARKMKVLFKKWIEVEEKIGDQDHIDNIRKRAMEFIEKAKF